MITDANKLAESLAAFGTKVRSQLPALWDHYISINNDGEFQLSNKPGEEKSIRAWCDCIEIASMFDTQLPQLSNAELQQKIRSFQCAVTGITPPLNSNSGFPSEPFHKVDRYDTMITAYALECLKGAPIAPIASDYLADDNALLKILETLPWANNAWAAGHWVDCYASSLYINERHFSQKTNISLILDWLDQQISPKSGMWGSWSAESRWLLPVNGFYRLTRGTYAQFGRALPYPEHSIDTILFHAQDAEYFQEAQWNACNVLDIIHPLWLCASQSDYRAEEIQQLAGRFIPAVLEHWVDEQGFDFQLAKHDPGLMGSEMWLSIVYLMAELVDLSRHLRYKPKGVHRLLPAWRETLPKKTKASN